MADKVSPRTTERSMFLNDVSAEMIDEQQELDEESQSSRNSDRNAESEDDFGVNDSNFNFEDYKFQGRVDLEDIEEPEMMEELFSSRLGDHRPTPANALLAAERSVDGSMMSGRFSLALEEDDPFMGQTIELAELELKDLKEQEVK